MALLPHLLLPRAQSLRIFKLHKPFHHLRVLVRTDDKWFAGIELLDCCHVVVCQGEVEHVEVLTHTLDFCRLWYDDNAELY